MANPTATSAAATTMMKNTNTCPSWLPLNLEKAANKTFTELSINSIDMKMTMKFLLNSTPITPIEKRIELKKR